MLSYFSMCMLEENCSGSWGGGGGGRGRGRIVGADAFLTFTEHEVAFDVKRLDLDVGHVDCDALLVVSGDQREGLLSRTHI